MTFQDISLIATLLGTRDVFDTKFLDLEKKLYIIITIIVIIIINYYLELGYQNL